MDHEELEAENVAKMMKDGPRLRWDYNQWVEAVDEEAGMAWIGGLGSFGIGHMWVEIAAHVREYPGFADAPRARMISTNSLVGPEGDPEPEGLEAGISLKMFDHVLNLPPNRVQWFRRNEDGEVVVALSLKAFRGLGHGADDFPEES